MKLELFTKLADGSIELRLSNGSICTYSGDDVEIGVALLAMLLNRDKEIERRNKVTATIQRNEYFPN